MSGRKQELANWDPGEYQAFAAKKVIWQHAQYGDVVATLTANLSRDQLKIAFFEEIHQDRRKWLGEMGEFLDVRYRYSRRPASVQSQSVGELSHAGVLPGPLREQDIETIDQT